MVRFSTIKETTFAVCSTKSNIQIPNIYTLLYVITKNYCCYWYVVVLLSLSKWSRYVVILILLLLFFWSSIFLSFILFVNPNLVWFCSIQSWLILTEVVGVPFDHVRQSLIIYQQHRFLYCIRLFLVYLFSLRTSIGLLMVTCLSLSSSFNKEIVLQSVPISWWHLPSVFVRLFVTVTNKFSLSLESTYLAKYMSLICESMLTHCLGWSRVIHWRLWLIILSRASISLLMIDKSYAKSQAQEGVLWGIWLLDILLVITLAYRLLFDKNK